MDINDNLVGVLNDLIRINNDRIEGYKRAAKEADDSDVDLKAIFYRMADESRQYLAELTREVVKLGGEPAEGTTASGKIYRAWMDIKATFTGHDRLTVLENCEFGEDAAQKAYQEALTSDETLSIDVRQLIANQKAALQISHDTIKKYRDMHKNLDSEKAQTSEGLRSASNMSGSDTFRSTESSRGSDSIRGSGNEGSAGSDSFTGTGTSSSGEFGSANQSGSGSLRETNQDDEGGSGSTTGSGSTSGPGSTRNN